MKIHRRISLAFFPKQAGYLSNEVKPGNEATPSGLMKPNSTALCRSQGDHDQSHYRCPFLLSLSLSLNTPRTLRLDFSSPIYYIRRARAKREKSPVGARDEREKRHRSARLAEKCCSARRRRLTPLKNWSPKILTVCDLSR